MEGKRLVLILAVALIQYCREGNGQGLEASLANARLPTRRLSCASAYDGDDFIYIFGGYMRQYRSLP
jgi:hypothetical protein